MPQPQDFEKDIQEIIKNLNKQQATIMAKRLSAAFVLGFKNKVIGKDQPVIAQLQINAIKKLSEEQIGYLQEFNIGLAKQLTLEMKGMIAEGKGYEQIKQEMIPYIETTFGTGGQVTIDHTGQTKTKIEVWGDGSLHEVEYEITQPYTNSVESYADMLARTSTHAAYEEGRVEGYKAMGITKWQFIGVLDERTRPEHAVLVGRVFEYDTPESDMAMEILSEPNCRHRAIPIFDDPELDSPQSDFDAKKKAAGLEFRDGIWVFHRVTRHPALKSEA